MANSRMLSDGDFRFTKMVTRLHPSQLGPGELALSENGRMDVNGEWAPREGYKNVSGVTLSSQNEAILVGSGEDKALILIGVQGSCTGADQGGGTIRITTPAPHGLPSGHTSIVNLDGFTGGVGDIDGNREATYVSTTTFDVTVSGASGAWASGTVGPVKLSGDAVAIRGACLFSDPDDTNADYIIIADNVQATAIKVSTLAKTTIAYPAGETLGQDCDLVQEFDVVVLRQAGATSWYFDPDDGSTGFGGTPAFVKFGTGAATQHAIFDGTNNTAIADGVATVTESNSLSAGDKVLIVDASEYEVLEGTTVEVATASGSDFTFYVNAEDNTATSIVYSTGASLGGGFVNPPGAEFGISHQRRSWVKYNYDSEATPAHRGVEDEIIASDILSHVYDPISSQFRISSGRADHIVALHGFDDDRLLVFCRNSVHYIKGVSGSLADTEVIQLTTDVGCVARKSVVSYGDSVYFWGDQGAYAVNFLDEYNLRGTELPLSEAVQSIVARITKSAADGIIGKYHDNQIWWAIPLDGSTTNNYFLIFNLLQGGWESLDSTNAGKAWSVIELIEARSGKVNELYAVTQFGGVHKLSGTGAERDFISPPPGSSASAENNNFSVPAAMTTRAYHFGNLRRKKFNKLRAHICANSNFIAHGDFEIIVEDPSQTVDMGQIRDEFAGGVTAGTTATLHKRCGNPRGFSAQVKFTAESGRPAIRALQLDAVQSFESVTSVS